MCVCSGLFPFPVLSPCRVCSSFFCLSVEFCLLRFRGITKIWVKLLLREIQPEGQQGNLGGGRVKISYLEGDFLCIFALCAVISYLSS